jgi:phosphonate transport system substrate-binding protein
MSACNTRTASATGGGPDGSWPTRITIVSVADENDPAAIAGDEQLRKDLEEYLGIQVEVFAGAIYAIAIEALRAGNLDVMLVTPMSFFLAQQMADIDTLVYAKVADALPYKTVFMTQSGRDDINNIHDLEGKTFAFVDPASSSGYMYPASHLVTYYGLDPDQMLNSGYFFEYVAFSGRHDASIVGVSMGDYDAAAVAYSVLHSQSDAGVIDMDEIKIIGETRLIPPPLYVMRSDLPQSLKDALTEFYLSYDDPAYFEVRHGNADARYIRAQESDYDVIADTIAALNLEIGG